VVLSRPCFVDSIDTEELPDEKHMIGVLTIDADIEMQQ
jgi:hypothetical protein